MMQFCRVLSTVASILHDNLIHLKVCLWSFTQLKEAKTQGLPTCVFGRRYDTQGKFDLLPTDCLKRDASTLYLQVLLVQQSRIHSAPYWGV